MNHIYYDVHVDVMPPDLQPSTAIDTLLAVSQVCLFVACMHACLCLPVCQSKLTPWHVHTFAHSALI